MGYLKYCGDIMMNVGTSGDIMSTMRGVQYRGRTQVTKDYSPMVLNTYGTEHTLYRVLNTTVLMISPHVS